MTKLTETLTAIFAEEIEKDIQKEIENEKYLSQESFGSCSARADAMIYNAIERVRKVYALAIVNHRRKEHEEDYGEEETNLIATMDTADIQTAETRGFWSD